MKLLRRRSPSLTSLFISCFVVAVVIQPTQAKQVTEIHRVQELDRSARTVKEWFAQIEQQNPPAQSQEGEVVQVTSVKANPTSSGVEVILQTLKGQQLQVVNRSSGNNFIADIPNAQLRLPSGDAFTFRSTKPIAGVSEITVTNFDANTIRVSVTGEAGVPIVELFDSPDEGIIFSVATAASSAQRPQKQPTQPQEQPGSQTQPSLPSPASNQPIELVVTGEQDQGYNPSQTSVGTRTDTPLRDIPNTIQIVPQQVIKDRNVTNVNSALENVSGVQQSFGNISVRGFTAQQTVDGGLSGAADFSNVEQVEVLRGPAAVLFGAGGLGGIINITTKQPLFDPFYELGLNVGSDSFYRGTADLSGPLTQNRNLRYRLNIALQDAYDSQNFSSSQNYFIAPTIAWDISNDTKLTLNFEYLNQPSKSYGVRALNGSFLQRDPNYDFPDDTHTDSSTMQGGYRFEHRFNKNLQLRNSLSFSSSPGHGRGISYGRLSDEGFIDRTYTDDGNVYETYTMQTGLLANFNTGSIAHQALFGVDATRDRERFIGFGISLPSLDISNPNYDIELPSTHTPHSSDYNQQYNTDSYGVFLQDQIKFLDNLILVVAGRLDWVTITASDYVAGTADTNYSATFSPRIGIVYQPIKPLSLYANYSRALDTADITGRRTRMGETFAPSLSTQYEAGIKTDFLDGKLSAVLAAYQITRTNVLTPDPLNNADEDFNIQIGEQRSRGIDFTVAGEILPGWNVTAGYSYIDAILTKDEVYGVGSPVVFTPHNSANLWTTYRIQSSDLQGLGFGLGVYFVDERPGGEFVERDYKIPAYTRFDAALFYRRNNWEATLNFENLFDSEYIVNSRGPGSETFGAPFTIRGSVKVRF